MEIDKYIKGFKKVAGKAAQAKELVDAMSSILDFSPNKADELRVPEQVHRDFYDLFNKISFLKGIDPLIGGYPMVFMTKPPISIFGYRNGDYSHVPDKEKEDDFITKEFSFFKGDTRRKLDNSNWIKNASVFFRGMDIPDLVMNVEGSITNLQKEKNMHPTFFTGHNGATTNISMLENSDLEMTKTINAWYLYIKYVSLGYITPPLEMITGNIVDYKTSVYLFYTKPNMKDILFFAKFTGVFPTKVPLSSHKLDVESFEVRKLETEWSFDYFEFMDSRILDDFNAYSSELGFRVLEYPNKYVIDPIPNTIFETKEAQWRKIQNYKL